MVTTRKTAFKLSALVAAFAAALSISAVALGSNSSEVRGTEIPGPSEALAQLEAEAVRLTEGATQDAEMECWVKAGQDWNKDSLQGTVLGACGPFNTPEAEGQLLVITQGETANGIPVIRFSTLSPSNGAIAQPVDSALDAAVSVWGHLEQDYEVKDQPRQSSLPRATQWGYK